MYHGHSSSSIYKSSPPLLPYLETSYGYVTVWAVLYCAWHTTGLKICKGLAHIPDLL